ncbi:MAG: signal recognition particle protein [Candidatus Phytoplasma asteris]|nr:signal recognition particle protein ['Chrysanthemum coronarium' phytoplasma]TKA88005.1 MAG: signal recognition particle subunit FFH/SRP54 [Periwinkle leaf yellowing phytoplasma]WEX19502.1 MAG: signal recognition particle protein [Candidatus Phytoplasma asteris]GAK74124.1 signal recognition particle GTPase ['Chrysanthemum coronarium' phytoplasma]
MSILGEGLQKVINKIRGKKILEQQDIQNIMQDIKVSLVEADVHLQVIDKFNEIIEKKTLKQEVLKGLNPKEHIIKIVNETLIQILGSTRADLTFKPNCNLDTLMLIGLQGSGKTTTVGKLALWLRKKNSKKVLLVACDIYRPGAVEQLKVIGKQINIDVFSKPDTAVLDIVDAGLKHALQEGYDAVIIDTAGRLDIDETMMQELQQIKAKANPSEILLVVDCLSGQQSANIAQSFHNQVGATGVILTKMDADTKGGAALSVRAMTDLPLKFVSSSETIDSLDPFNPDRMASRLLGMGDILTLIETVTDKIDPHQSKQMMEKLFDDSYNYYDFQKQLKTLKKIGSVSKLLSFIPGLGGKMKQLSASLGDDGFNKFEVLIQSMTKQEKKNPQLIALSGRRRQRIAKGSGNQLSDVNKLITLLEQQKKLAKQMQHFDDQDLDKLQNDPMAFFRDMNNK